MSVVWQLIRKDHRVFGWWLALWSGLQILVTVLAYFRWLGGSAPGFEIVLFPAALIVGTLLIVRIVHEEPLMRGVDFWRTRPLRPKHLLLGKGLTIGLHFVLIRSLICLVLLLATGYRSYLGLAGVEWFGKLAIWLIPVMAIAVFTDSLPRFLGIALNLGLGFGILLAIHLWIQSGIGWNGPGGKWASLPSGTVVFGMAIVLFGGILTLRQYLVDGLHGAIKWLVLGAIVIQGLWWLPLSGIQFAHQAPLPPSNAALDELTGDLDFRIGPLPPHDQTFTERNRVEVLEVQREPSLVVASRNHDLDVSFDESASRLETVQGDIVSSNPQWVWKTPVHPEDCLGSIGAIEKIPRFHMGSCELLGVPRSVVRQLQGTSGTLHLEALAVLRESELVARLPLRVGARLEHGPEAIQIHAIERSIGHGRPSVRIDCQILYPKRFWTRPWPRIVTQGFELNWLVHRRLHFVLHFGGWDGKSGKTGPMHPLMGSRRYFRRFDGSDGANAAPSLWEEEFQPEDWDMVFVRKRITASKRLPVTVPEFQLWRELPETSEGLLANLEAVSLPENASDAEVEDYLWDLCRAWKAGAWSILGERRIQLASAQKVGRGAVR